MSLKLARQIARLTQQQLAAKARVPTSTISRLEDGKRKIDTVAYGSVVRIARTLSPGVPVEELFPVVDDDRKSA